MTLRERFALPLPPAVAFRLRLLGLEAIFAVLLILANAFDVIPWYVTSGLMWAFGIWFVFLGRRYDKTLKTITEDGWEEFLDGREELGEYEELGGKYETADTDEDDD